MKISSPRHHQRRERLAALIEEFGGATKLAIEAGTPKSHISALVAGDRGLGDALAAKLEKVAGKPAGWFDQPADAAMPFRDLAPLEAQLVTYFRDLSPALQIEVVLQLRAGLAPTRAPEPETIIADRPPVFGAPIESPSKIRHKKKEPSK